MVGMDVSDEEMPDIGGFEPLPADILDDPLGFEPDARVDHDMPAGALDEIDMGIETVGDENPAPPASDDMNEIGQFH